MRGGFEIVLARRYLRPARREGFVSVITAFSVLGIMLGVATLILVTSLMNGIRAEMTRLFIGIDGPIAVHTPPLGQERAAQLCARLREQPGITYALPKLTGQLMATHRGAAMGVQVVAVKDDDFSPKPILHRRLPATFDGLLLGEGLARSLGVRAGDSLRLISPQGRHSIAGFVPRIKTFRVAGTFKLGMHLYDSSLIIMPYDDALMFFKPPGAAQPVVSQIEIGLDDVQSATARAQALQRELGDSMYVADWQRSNAGLFMALDIQRNVMILILALIVIVAAFNIISSLIMLVQDKRGDIAILRTMGASRGQIMRAFCLCGTLIGVVGTLLGVPLGVLAAENLETLKAWLEALTGQKIMVDKIYFLSSLPTQTDISDVTAIALAAIALAFVATIHPARRAAGVSPAEALRYG